MLFFLCLRPTIKFQGGSPVDPLFEPPADPPFDSTSQKVSFVVISASLTVGHHGLTKQWIGPTTTGHLAWPSANTTGHTNHKMNEQGQSIGGA